ncbi:MAG: NYN domain-containing protein, partial [Acidimicrobiia bacterium]
MRLRIYVDGLNLYYRLLKKNKRAKWLDLLALSRRLFPDDDVVGVRYYTARIKPLDDVTAPQRQQVYLRALGSLNPMVTVHYGYFQIEEKWRRLANPVQGQNKSVVVQLPEEKGSDVNLASHLLSDAFTGRFEKAAVITNDADLAEPIRIVQHEIGLPVVVVHPTQYPAGVLATA